MPTNSSTAGCKTLCAHFGPTSVRKRRSDTQWRADEDRQHSHFEGTDNEGRCAVRGGLVIRLPDFREQKLRDGYMVLDKGRQPFEPIKRMIAAIKTTSATAHAAKTT
jgi:hypothetical protein